MRNFIAKHVEDIPPSGIRRFFDMVATLDKDIVSLGVGEPDFRTPEHIRKKVIEKLETENTKYSANLGMPVLRDEIAKYLNRRFSISYDAQTEILCTIGASEAIDVALRAVIEPDDEVIVVEPSYVCYKPSIILQHGVPVVVTTKNENKFRVTPEELEKAITPKTKMVILAYPSNPTGAIMEREDLEKIAPILIKHDLLVISDEIYSELTYAGKDHISIASIEGMHERTIVINGFSKSFAMTGWRLGYAAAPANIIKAMNKIHAYIVMSAPVPTQWAGIEALQDVKLCDEDIEKMRTAYDERRKYLVKEFDRLNLPCFEPEGAFYVFPSIKSTGLTSEEFCERLLMEGGVAVVPGNAFGDSGEGFIRISYAYSMQELKKCIEKIEIFLNEIL